MAPKLKFWFSRLLLKTKLNNANTTTTTASPTPPPPPPPPPPRPPSPPMASSPLPPPSTSLILSNSPTRHSFPSSNLNPNPTHLPSRPHVLTLATKSSSHDKKSDSETNFTSPPPLSPTEKKSFAVATGELFLGIATRILKRRNKGSPSSGSNDSGILMFDKSNGNFDYEERIGKVIEDEIEPDVIWEQRVKDVQAEKERRVVTSPGFSFSAAGLLFPYHLGVAQCLIEKGYIKESTPLAGSSAGAIVCAVIASGATMQEALQLTKTLAEDCRLKGTAFRLGAVLRDVLEKFLPDDVHIRSNGRVRVSDEFVQFTTRTCVISVVCLPISVAVTQILWRPRGLLVDQFDSKEDLINAVFTSSFIPGYLAPRPATMFRNRLCVDGGLTLFMPPTSADKTVFTVRVCAFPASRIGLEGIGISPDCNPENRATARQLFNWALEPAEDHILDQLFEVGYLDAAVWAEQNPVEQLVRDDCSPNKESVSL
ncbi:Patatin-like phospholipase domain-containing protein 2 [Linum perenne]